MTKVKLKTKTRIYALGVLLFATMFLLGALKITGLIATKENMELSAGFRALHILCGVLLFFAFLPRKKSLARFERKTELWFALYISLYIAAWGVLPEMTATIKVILDLFALMFCALAFFDLKSTENAE